MAEPAKTREVIVTRDPAQQDALAAIVAFAKGEPVVYKNFPVVSFRCAVADVGALEKTPGVVAVHQPPLRFRQYSKILSYIDQMFAWDDDIRVGCPVNLSLSAGPGTYSENEPMNVATYAGACAGLVFVIAAGNEGPAENTLNPWSVAPWAIGVGAADEHGKEIWEHSSVGIAGDPLYRPTVVAPGKDVPVLAVPIAAQNLAHGTAVAGVILRLTDPAGKVPQSGTSLAAPTVTRLCVYAAVFMKILYSTDEKIRGVIASGIVDINDAFWLSQMEPLTGLLPRLRALGLDFKVGFGVLRCKRMIEEMARPMEGFGVHQVGAGFVDEEIARAYLTGFTLRDFLRIFVSEEQHGLVTEDLDMRVIPKAVMEQVLDWVINTARLRDAPLG